MKNFYVISLSIALTLVSFISSAQNSNKLERSASEDKKACAAWDNHSRMRSEDPNYRTATDKIESQTATFSATTSYASLTASSTILTIPVVVNVIYNVNNPKENISDAQIASQIAVLNEDYRKTNADLSKTPSLFSGLTADMGIQFQVVKIVRKSSTKTSWGTRDAMKKSKSGGIDATSPSTHLNMWVCNIGGGILGYAQFPGGTLATDGVVMGPNYFGSSKKGTGFYLSAPYDLGRTATHEVGHWLNLRHIWGDATCGNDQVSDTPTAQTANYGCPTFPRNGSCGTTEMTMNYMDYTDDPCMYMFTQGQAVRARALFVAGGARAAMGGAGFVAREEATVASSNNFEVYPNPTSGTATLRVNLATESDLTVNITDVQGRVISTTSFAKVSTLQHSIDVNGMINGMYFVNINGEGFKEVKKLFVVK